MTETKTKTCPTCGVHIDEHEALACLDTWAGTDVMGWETNGITWCIPGTRDRYPGYGVEHWRPSKDIAAAWQVLEKLTTHYEVNISRDNDVLVSCLFVMGGIADFDRWYLATAPTVPLAICRAAIMSMEAQ